MSAEGTVPPGLTFLGNGPAATGGCSGWRMSPRLFLRCPRCRQFISADPASYERCRCGLLVKDPDTGWIGTGGDDDEIAVFESNPR